MSVAHTDDINENVEVPLSGLTADLDVFAEAVVAERAPSPPVVSTGNSRAIAAALAETESSVRVASCYPVRSCTSTGWLRVRRLSRQQQGRLRASFIIERALGHHLPAGYCDLLLELRGLYFEAPGRRRAPDGARVIASDWARPVDRSVLLFCFFFFLSTSP